MLKRFAIVLAGVVLVLGGFAVFHFVILPARLAEFLAPLLLVDAHDVSATIDLNFLHFQWAGIGRLVPLRMNLLE